jgi:hypothetical protein
VKYEKTNLHPNLKRAPNGTLYYVEGRRERSLKTKDDAEGLRRLKNLLARGGDILTKSTKLRIKDLADDYLADRRIDLRRKEIRPVTLAGNEKYLKKIVDIVGSVSTLPTLTRSGIKFRETKSPRCAGLLVTLCVGA